MKNNTAIILLLLSVGISYTFTNGQYQDVKELQALSNKYSETLQNAAAIVELRDRLLVTYESLPQSDIERIGKALPDKMLGEQDALNALYCMVLDQGYIWKGEKK